MKAPLSEAPEKEWPDYRDPTGEYVPVSIEGLSIGPTEDFDLFVRTGNDYFLVKPKNLRTDPKIIATYKGTQPYLYIRSKEREEYFKKIEEAVTKIVQNPQVTIREKAAVLTDCAVEIVDKIFTDPGNPKTMSEAKHFAQDCVLFIGQHPHAFLHLVELSNHDHYTYAHSVGVAAYSVALAKNMGNYSSKELSDVGLAGMLHDIGKCLVDPAIINKKGSLTEAEWAIMKKHPEFGSDILRRHKALAPMIALAAECHHENLLETGYPKRLQAAKLDPIIRIISLSDAFSALTTRRSYSPARNSMNALLLMRENIDKKFDSALFKKFVPLFLDSQTLAASKKAA